MPRDLICPVCSNELAKPSRCESCGNSFEEVDGLPVLIDFADSIFTPADYVDRGGAVVERRSGGGRVGRFLTNLTYGHQDVPARGAFLDRLAPGARVLVVGGAAIGDGFNRLYAGAYQVVGTDVYPSPNIALICDGHKLPFADASFDAVVIQAVLEHVVSPDRVAAEVHRVLRRAGLVYAETPFMQQVHEGAYDFTRFTLSGHRWLFRGFEEIDAGSVLGPGTALLWSIAHYVRSIGLGQRAATVITALFFWVRKLERPGRLALDSASGLYFIGAKSEVTLHANQLPAYYSAGRD